MDSSFPPRARRRALLYVVAVLGAAAVALATSSGPDVTVLNLTDIRNYTTSGPVDGYRAYAIGTDACNVGDQPVWWCNGNTAYCSDEQHPVIA